jgi:hypothetical protein
LLVVLLQQRIVTFGRPDSASGRIRIAFAPRLRFDAGMAMALTMIFWWVTINLVVAATWSCYCLWPRRRFTSQIPEYLMRRL